MSLATRIDEETGAEFDDWTEQDISLGFTYWTQVCDQCLHDYNLPDFAIAEGEGHGICGVVGCNNQSDHYYDFSAEVVK